MDSVVDFTKFGFHAGQAVRLADDEWSSVERKIILVDVEPVPGSTQCLIRVGDDLQTVSRGELRPA